MAWAMSAISTRMRSIVSPSAAAKAVHFLSMALDALEPVLVDLAAHIIVEEGAARHLVALGEAEHLAAQRGQAAVVAVERLDQGLDLRIVELDAFDLGGQLLAQLVVLLLLVGGEVGDRGEGEHARALDLGELLVDRGDGGELLQRLGG